MKLTDATALIACKGSALVPMLSMENLLPAIAFVHLVMTRLL